MFLQERTGRICQVDVPPIEENVTLCPQILEELQRVLLLALSEDMCVRPPFPLVKLFPGAKIPRLIVLFHCHAPWSQRLCLTMYATRHRSERYASISTPTFATGKDYEESAGETLNRTYSERKKMGFLDEIEVK